MGRTSDSIDRAGIRERLAAVQPGSIRSLFAECVAGDTAPNLVLARLLLAVGRVEEVEELVAQAAQAWGQPLDPHLRELARLLHDHREGCLRVARMLREHPDPEEAPDSAEAALDLYRDFFDRAVTWSEEASVAAYCLADPDLLREVTREVADAFAAWGLLGPDRRVLEIGCGIGRMQAALASRVAEAHGIDLSPKMIEAGRRRCAGLANVHLATTSGRDLAQFPEESFDLVFAVDSFPYVHQAGPDVVAAHFHEAARVLRPGGEFVILHYSYRDDIPADRAEVRRLCHAAGFSLAVAGAEPFRLWDGVVFRCRRS